jgi:hypothetical protein
MTLPVGRRIGRKWGLVGAAVFLVAVAGATLAIHNDNVFQIDGNAFASDPGSPPTTGDDWDEIMNNTDSALVDTGIVTDPLSQTTDRIFTGGGSKDDLNVPGWRHTTGSVPDKDNIEHAFAAAYNTCPDVQPDADHPDADTDTDPDFCLYFGLDRFARNGDAQVGFWFFQDDVGPITTGPDAGKFSGTHTVGDILVLSHFTNGGVVGTVQVFEWVGTGGDTNGTLNLIAIEGSCPTTGTVHTTCGASNTAVKPSPWFYDAKSGPDNSFPQGSFYEGGVNLSALGHGDTCVASFIAETRSSQSVDAVLKDFASGSFSLCSAKIEIAADGVNRVGASHPVTVTVTQTQNGVDSPAADGTIVDLDIVSGPGTLSAETCTTTNGTCSVTLDSSVTGVTRVHASADVDVGDATITVETDGVSPNSDDLFKRWVDARISIDPDDVNRVGENHTFTVTVEADSGSGSFAAVDVAAVTVGLAGDADSVVNNCANGTGDAGDVPAEAVGTCTVTFTSDTPGTVTGSASASVALTTAQGNINVPVATTDANSTTGNAVKRFVDARISIDPDDVNRIGESHTFTVTVEANTGSGFAAVDVAAVTVGLLGDADSVVNNCANGTGDAGDTPSEAVGTCTVTFTSDTPGTVTGSASASVSLTTAQGNIVVPVSTTDANSTTGNAIKRFVDARIGIDPDDVNSIGESHTFTVTVEANTGSGFAAVDVAAVTVGLVGDADSVVNNCANGTGDAGDTPSEAVGTCTVTFTSDTAGTVTGSASATVALVTAQGNINVPVSTTDANSTTGNAVKEFKDGTLIWHKEDNHGNPLGGATFEYCRTHNLNTSTDPDTYDNITPDVCVSVLDNAGTDANPADGEFLIEDLVLGTYTVRETAAPAGYHIDNPNAVAAGSHTLLDTELEIVEPFVNSRAFRLIVLTCDDVTEELVVSVVTLDPDGAGGAAPIVLDTIDADDLAAFNLLFDQDLTEGQACNLGGAQFEDLDEGTYVPSVVIPKAS